MQDGLLSPREATQYLRERHGLKYSHLSLANMRMEGTGPIYEKDSASIRGRIFYRPADLDAWVASRFRRCASTSEYSDGLQAA